MIDIASIMLNIVSSQWCRMLSYGVVVMDARINPKAD